MPEAGFVCALWEALPREVLLSGRGFPVETDFRAYLRLTVMLLDQSATEEERLYACLALYQGEVPEDLTMALEGLLWFYRRGRAGETPKGGKKLPASPVLSYTADQWFLTAAFRQVYGINLLTVGYLHWWEFCGLLEALPEDCPLKRRMAYRGIRLSEIRDRRERARIRRIQQAIALPSQHLDDGNIGAVLWTGGETNV